MEAVTGRIALASLLAVLGAALLTWRPRGAAAGRAAAHLTGLGIAGRLGAVRRLAAGDILRYTAHGVLSFGCGYYLFFYAIQGLGVSRAAIITSAWPLIACAAGIVLYREALTWRKAAGIALIALSVALVTR